MAREKYPHKALDKLLNADATLATADLNTLADSSASATDVNLLAGAATSGLAGVRRKVTASAVAMTGIGEAYSGSVITNEGAADARTFALSAAVVGVELTFVVMAAQELRIVPNGTETIGLPSTGVQGAAGKYLTADAVGEWVKLTCVKAGQWVVTGYFGTWAHEGE